MSCVKPIDDVIDECLGHVKEQIALEEGYEPWNWMYVDDIYEKMEDKLNAMSTYELLDMMRSHA